MKSPFFFRKAKTKNYASDLVAACESRKISKVVDVVFGAQKIKNGAEWSVIKNNGGRNDNSS